MTHIHIMVMPSLHKAVHPLSHRLAVRVSIAGALSLELIRTIEVCGPFNNMEMTKRLRVGWILGSPGQLKSGDLEGQGNLS